MGSEGIIKKVEEVKGTLPNAQIDQTLMLMDEITATILLVKGATKLGVEKRATILARLVKSHSELVKTQRTMLGLDHSTAHVTAGVIIIPMKSDPSQWANDAQVEITNAKNLILSATQPSENDKNDDTDDVQCPDSLAKDDVTGDPS